MECRIVETPENARRKMVEQKKLQEAMKVALAPLWKKYGHADVANEIKVMAKHERHHKTVDTFVEALESRLYFIKEYGVVEGRERYDRHEQLMGRKEMQLW